MKGNNVMLGSNLKIVTTESVAVSPKKAKAIKAKDTTATAIASVEKKAAKEIVLEDTKKEITDESEFYTVQKGDNLNSIAKKYGVTTAQIREWNNMEDTNVLLGSKLKLIKAENGLIETKGEKTEQQIATAVKEQQQYLVKKGDSLFSIAKKSGVTVENIKEWNGIGNETIKPGMRLKIQG
ncbi:MAG: LysM peptidoglycan-binding domain-containing protein [Flavobacterium sp.]|nr:MAG: LysM peptidoglycan-binding domain-containing protein [Flavobacterium sp.]